MGKGARRFWGFDTFTGLADVGDTDKHWGISYFRENQYAATKESVDAYLAEFPATETIAGYFPASAERVEDRLFSFVHLDVDTYRSTLESMRYFWPRLVNGGMIITHDSHAEGVANAIREFTAETDARAVPLAGSQLALLK
jgi:hypothetical protein